MSHTATIGLELLAGTVQELSLAALGAPLVLVLASAAALVRRWISGDAPPGLIAIGAAQLFLPTVTVQPRRQPPLFVMVSLPFAPPSRWRPARRGTRQWAPRRHIDIHDTRSDSLPPATGPRLD
jgi:hypothetical protein